MTPPLNIVEARRALNLLVEPGSVFEIRAIVKERNARGDFEHISFGYFDAIDNAIKSLPRHIENAVGVYATLNPVRHELLARCANRMKKAGKGDTTGDQHITRRTRILFDFDGTPVAGISSTDDEHDKAIACAFQAQRDLGALGFPLPIVGDSGNGAHLVYAVDLPVDDGGLVKRVLEAAHQRWGSDQLKVDVVNANPARITKLYGTPTRKGDSTTDRPHRTSKILSAPDSLKAVPRDLLEAFAATATQPEPVTKSKSKSSKTTASASSRSSVELVRDFISKHGIAASDPHRSGDKLVWVLDECPFNADHARGEAHISVRDSGVIGAECKHGSCDWKWTELRERFEPDVYSRHEEDPTWGRVRCAGGAVRMAGDYVRKFYTHDADGPTLRRWRGDYYRWCADRGHYQVVSDEGIEASLYRDLGLGRRQDVGDVRHALIAVDNVLIDHADLGSWLGSAPSRASDPLDVAACSNGLLHLPTRTLIPVTPRYFATTALGAPFDASQPAPARWMQFLEQLWPDDEQSIEALQEWFGYMLTPDTRQQKILLLVGQRRSGKGTIMRVLTALLGGPVCIASPTLASLGTNFGLQPLIGKSAAIVGDARLSGRNDIAQVIERLLSISGQDPQTIDRKHREPWTGFLSARFAIVSNELPRFPDASDALAGRMLILELAQSWYGKENIGLTDALLKELPGILLWAVEGWQRLRARGYFVQPESSRDAIAELEDLGSPVRAWVRERCAPKNDLVCSLAYEHFKSWCRDNGHERVPTQTVFGRDMKAAGYKRIRRSGQDPGHEVDDAASRPWVYAGVSLR